MQSQLLYLKKRITEVRFGSQIREGGIIFVNSRQGLLKILNLQYF